MVEQIPVPDNLPPKKLYHGSGGFIKGPKGVIAANNINYDIGFHVGTYNAAVDRRAGTFGDDNINKIIKTAGQYVDDKLENYSSDFMIAAEDYKKTFDSSKSNPLFYDESIFYKLNTDKPYIHEVRIMGFMEDDRATMRLFWSDDVIRSTLQGRKPDIIETQEYAYVDFDDLGQVDEVYSGPQFDSWIKSQSKLNTPEYFTNDILYEITMKPEAVQAKFKDIGEVYLAFDGTHIRLSDADNMANNLQRYVAGFDGNLDWNGVSAGGFIAELDIATADQVRDGIISPNQALAKSKNLYNGSEFLDEFGNADMLSYTNVVEDKGQKSYIILNGDIVDIQPANTADQIKFQLEVDKKQTETFMKPLNLYSDVDTTQVLDIPENVTKHIESDYIMSGMRNMDRTVSTSKDARILFLNDNVIPTVKGTGNINTLSDEILNIINPEQTLKEKAKKRIANRGKNLGKRLAVVNPLAGGPIGAAIMEALDYYETFVMTAGLAYAFAPDIDTFVKNQANNMLEIMAGAAGYKINLDDYEYDWQRVNKSLDWIEAVSPTDIVLKKAGKLVSEEGDTGEITGFNASFGYVPVEDKLGKTLTSGQTKEKERDPMYDRISRTFSGQY